MPDYRKATRRAAVRHGVDPGVLERLVQQESGFNKNARSPAGARDIAQFMPATAKQYGVTLGDNRAADDLDGAARMIREALDRNGGDYKKALSVYNSGRPDGYKRFDETRNYVAKILGSSGGAPAPTRSPVTGATPRTSLGSVPSGPAVTPTGDTRGDLLKQYLQQRGRPGATMALATGLGDLKAPTSNISLPGASSTVSASTAASGTGSAKITGPNPGRIKPQVVDFMRRTASIYGKPIVGSDGTGHSRLTVNGNVSQHSTGNASDIPATGKELIRMGQAALEAAGMPRAQARKQTGGLFNVGGHQIIFNTQEGGDHTDHLHVSAK